MIILKPCKYCGRTGWITHKTDKIGSQITKDKCIYCNGRGFIREDSEKGKEEKNINTNDSKMKGGNTI